jgi:hypothetical protein
MRNLMLASAIALMIPATSIAASDPAPATAIQASPAPANNRTAVAEKIKADWVKYDVGAKGHLTRPELAKWLTDLRVAAGQPAPDAEWQKSAFVQTDSNSDAKISLEELTAFLTSGA